MTYRNMTHFAACPDTKVTVAESEDKAQPDAVPDADIEPVEAEAAVVAVVAVVF
jgi:hypothetical protein